MSTRLRRRRAERSTTRRGPSAADAERRVVVAIGVGRIAWGATTALAPGAVHRTLGMTHPGPDRDIWVRAFGLRDIALGAVALHPATAVQRATLRAGIVIDLLDAVAILDAARHGLPRRTAVAGTALAAGTALTAIAAPRVLRARTG